MKHLFYFLLLLLYSCSNVSKEKCEICRLYLTPQSGVELGMTKIYNDGTIQVSTGIQRGIYHTILLDLLFDNKYIKNYDEDLFDDYYAQEENILSDAEQKNLIQMLSDVHNKEYKIKESEDMVDLEWIGVIIAGEKEWSFYDGDVDGRMRLLFDYLRNLSMIVLEDKVTKEFYAYPFI